MSASFPIGKRWSVLTAPTPALPCQGENAPRGGREGLELSACPLQRLGAELLLQEIEPDPQPDVPLGIGIEDRIDGARGTAVAAGKHLHQGAARPIIPVMKSDRQTIPARQRQLTQGFAAAGPQGRGDGEPVPCSALSSGQWLR